MLLQRYVDRHLNVSANISREGRARRGADSHTSHISKTQHHLIDWLIQLLSGSRFEMLTKKKQTNKKCNHHASCIYSSTEKETVSSPTVHLLVDWSRVTYIGWILFNVFTARHQQC